MGPYFIAELVSALKILSLLSIIIFCKAHKVCYEADVTNCVQKSLHIST